MLHLQGEKASAAALNTNGIVFDLLANIKFYRKGQE